jgi:c-di-GMP-binding flagellar brake protein YcgR
VSKKDVPERRQFPRANVVTLAVIKCDVRANVGNEKTREFHTHTQNISEGGVNVILEEELPKQDSVELKLYLTGKKTPIECKGQVAWSKAVSPPGVEPGIFSTGIKFTEFSPEAKEAIRNIISCFSD